MRKQDKYYALSFDECKVISAKAYVFLFKDAEYSMVLPKSQVEVDVDTNTVYVSSWLLKRKIENEDTGHGVLPDELIDWLMNEIDWEEGDAPDA